MASKSVEQLQADYDAALAKEQDNPGDEKARKAAGTAHKKLAEARGRERQDRGGITVAGDVTVTQED